MKEEYSTMGIYRITNTVNGNIYIGKTGVNFGDRWDCHRAQLNGGYHDNPHLQAAWNKYGQEAFEFCIVEKVVDVELLNELEKRYIKLYRDSGMCYNIHDGGDGGHMLGKHLSDEAKRKIGEKNRAHMTGRKASEETRRKMSESHKRRYASWTDADRIEYGKKVSEYASGYHWDDDAKRRFSDMQKTSPNGAKYTIDQVREIRRMREEEGLDYTTISQQTGVSRHAVYLIATYRRWKYV